MDSWYITVTYEKVIFKLVPLPESTAYQRARLTRERG